MAPGGRPRQRHKDMPTGMKLVDGRWYWRPTSEATRLVAAALGAKGSVSTGTGEKAAARQWWVKTVLPLIDKAVPMSPIEGTVEELLRKYEIEVIPKKYRSDSGREGETRYVEEIRREFGATPYARSEAEGLKSGVLTAVLITQFLHRNEHRPSIANRVVRCLRRVFAVAHRRWGLTTFNPAAGAEYHEEVPRDVYVDDDRYLKIYAKASPVLQCMMALAQMAGPRKGMILAIKDADIDRQNGQLWLTPNKQRGKRPAPRYPITITDDVSRVLDAAIKIREGARGKAKRAGKAGLGGQTQDNDFIFLTRAGHPYNKSAFARIWKSARSAAGFEAGEITFHDLRAKAGSDSASDDDAQARLKHKDRGTTVKVYRRKVSAVEPLPKVK